MVQCDKAGWLYNTNMYIDSKLSFQEDSMMRYTDTGSINRRHNIFFSV